MMIRNLFLLAAALACPAAFADAIYGTLAPGSSVLPANDDGSTGAVNLGFSANFFGATFSNVYVNNNGNFTFGAPLGTFTPFGLTGATGTRIIAPFFADVDTRGAGSSPVTYGAAQFTTNDGVLRDVFVGNWINVGYFSAQFNLLNSFQAVLVSRPETGVGNFDIVFNYGQIQWETGGASGGSGGLGGSSARAGYSAGTAASGTFYEFVGSGVNGSLLDTGANGLRKSSNVNPSDLLYTRLDGRYVFNVRAGQVLPPTGVPEPSSIAVLSASVLAIGFFRRRTRANKH